MPLYEYECARCGERTEQERKMSERKKTTVCASCGSKKTRLVPSTTSFALIGGGWASTGYSVKKGK